MQRNRITYGLLILVTIALGLLSRAGFTPKVINPYLGDFLYAVMCFWIVGLVYPAKTATKVALISISACYFIEFSQLWQMDWLNSIRSYKIGKLILGSGFLWSDLFSYTLGGITACLLEHYYYQQKTS